MEHNQQELSTREKILEAAKKLFSENGYHNTSMSAIAREADLGKGTLYWHFDSKNDLFKELFKKEGEIIKKQIKWLSKQNLSPEKILYKFISARLERMLSHKKITQMFLDSENYINIDFKNTILKLRGIILDELEEVIKKGIESGKFRDIDTRETAVAVLGMINNIAINIVTEDIDDITNTREFLYDFIVRGLAREKEEGE